MINIEPQFEDNIIPLNLLIDELIINTINFSIDGTINTKAEFSNNAMILPIIELSNQIIPIKLEIID